MRLFGPILPWEMTTLMRRSRYYWLRGLYASILFVFLVISFEDAERHYIYSTSPQQRAAHFANEFFWSYSIWQLTAAIFLTPGFVASAIVNERERKVIDYLFTSDLRNQEIVLGKWLARSLNLVVLMLTALPILSLTQFFGGVSGDLVFRSFLVSLATVGVIGAMSMVVSIYAESTWKALVSSYLVVLIALVTPFLGAMIVGDWSLSMKLLAPFNPYLMHDAVLRDRDNVFTLGVGQTPFIDVAPLTFHLGVNSLLTSLLIGWAIYRVRSVQLQSTPRATRIASAAKQKVDDKFAPASKIIGNDAMRWKEWKHARFFGNGWMIYAALILFTGLYYYGFFLAVEENQSSSSFNSLNLFVRIAGPMLMGLGYLLTAVRASSCMGVEKDRDCWISLLATPMSGKEIVLGKLWGATKPTFGMLLILLPSWLIAAAMFSLSLFAVPVMLFVYLFYGFVAATIGLRRSLRSPTTNSAVGSTFGILIAVFGLAQSLMMMVVGPLSWVFGDRWLFGVMAASIPWLHLGFAGFSWHELAEVFKHDNPLWVFFGGVWLAIYGAVAMMVLNDCVRRFDHYAGRVPDQPVETLF